MKRYSFQKTIQIALLLGLMAPTGQIFSQDSLRTRALGYARSVRQRIGTRYEAGKKAAITRAQKEKEYFTLGAKAFLRKLQGKPLTKKDKTLMYSFEKRGAGLIALLLLLIVWQIRRRGGGTPPPPGPLRIVGWQDETPSVRKSDILPYGAKKVEEYIHPVVSPAKGAPVAPPPPPPIETPKADISLTGLPLPDVEASIGTATEQVRAAVAAQEEEEPPALRPLPPLPPHKAKLPVAAAQPIVSHTEELAAAIQRPQLRHVKRAATAEQPAESAIPPAMAGMIARATEPKQPEEDVSASVAEAWYGSEEEESSEEETSEEAQAPQGSPPAEQALAAPTAADYAITRGGLRFEDVSASRAEAFQKRARSLRGEEEEEESEEEN